MSIAEKSTKVVTGKVRFSYVHIFEPKTPQGGGDPKYSVTLLIPKGDRTYTDMRDAICNAGQRFRDQNGAKSMPLQPPHTLHDGDGLRDNGEPYGPECKGHWVITASSKRPPVVVDENRNEIIDPTEVYSGCYGRAAVNFFAYNTNGKKGVSCGLLSIQKLHDGEAFGIVGSAADFDDDYKAANDDDFLG